MPRVTPSAVVPGLLSLELARHDDERGGFVEAFNADDWRFEREDGTPIAFVEDDYSFNRKGVVRGLHGDRRTWKLVTCVHGACFVAVVDFRDGPTRLAWEGHELDARAPRQLLIPAGCATGLASLADDTVFAYRQSERYAGAAEQFTLRWDDPAIGIDWPVRDPILSERDAAAPLLER